MAGFMAGFGPAFSQAFNAQRERSAQRKDDMFKLTYQNYLTKRKEWDDFQKEDSKRVNMAKSLAEQYGQPEESWTKIYQWLSEDQDVSDIRDQLSTGKFTVQQRGGTKVVSDEPVKPSSMAVPVDEQMQEVVPQAPEPMAPNAQQMAPEAPQAPEVPTPASEVPMEPAPQAPQASVIDTAPTSATPDSQMEPSDPTLFGIPGPNLLGQKHDPAGDALRQVAQVTGESPERLKEIMQSPLKPRSFDSSNVSFTPGKPAEKADPFGNLDLAMIELGQALRSGDQERITRAEDRVNFLKSSEAVKAELKAKSEGLSQSGALVNIFKDGRLVRTTQKKVLEDGTEVDARTGEPLEGAVPVTKLELEARQHVADELEKSLKDIRPKVSSHVAAMRNYAYMSDIVDRTNGEVLQGWTSSLYQNISSVVAEAKALTTQVGELVGNKQAVDDAVGTRLQDLYDKLLAEGGNDIGTQKALYEIQRSLMAYHLGASVGQEGRNLAENERKLFMELASGGISVNRFHKGMSDMLLGGLRNLDQTKKAVYDESVPLKQFKDMYYEAPEFKFFSEETNLETSSDPDLKRAYDQLIQSADLTTGPIRESDPLSEENAAKSTEQQTQDSPYPPGHIQLGPDGKYYRFKGGAWGDKNNWEQLPDVEGVDKQQNQRGPIRG